MTCAVVFSRGHGWDNAAVAAAGHDCWTHCAPLIEHKGEARVIDASHGKLVEQMSFKEWREQYPEYERVDLLGMEITPEVLHWFEELQGKEYDWGPVRWHTWKPVMWIASRLGHNPEHPDKYACAEATIRCFHSEGFYSHLLPSNWYRVHPDGIYSAVLQRRAGYRAYRPHSS